MKAVLCTLSLAVLGLAACNRPTGTAPEDSKVGAAMPDTGAARNPDARMTAPDAGATGTVPENGTPAVAPTPPEGTAGGASGTVAPTTDQIPPR